MFLRVIFIVSVSLVILSNLGAQPAFAFPMGIAAAQEALDDAAALAPRNSKCRVFISQEARTLADDLTQQSLVQSLNKLDTLQDDAAALCPTGVRRLLRRARNELVAYQIHRGWTPRWYWDTLEQAQASCDHGYGQGCYVLAERYQQGRGVRKDLVLSQQLFEKACNNELGIACHQLGLMFREGRGVTKDEHKAVQYFQDACAKSHSEACYFYGLHLESGEGVMSNPIQAKSVFKRACAQGVKRACDKQKDPAQIGTVPGGEAYESEISL